MFLQQFAYLCDLPQYANGLIILKTNDGQFTLTIKKTMHLTFKAKQANLIVNLQPMKAAGKSDSIQGPWTSSTVLASKL